MKSQGRLNLPQGRLLDEVRPVVGREAVRERPQDIGPGTWYKENGED